MGLLLPQECHSLWVDRGEYAVEYLLDGLSPGYGRVDLRGIHPEGARTEGIGKETAQF
jgi:hypothetical protein